jgi:hypothetical protein
MATAPQDVQVTTFVHKELDWFKHHLISLALVAVLTFGAVYGIESMMANARHEVFLQAQTISQQQDKANAAIQAQNQATIATLMKQAEADHQQSQALLAANGVLSAALSKKQAEIKTLPPPVLATQWGAAAQEPAPVIDAQGDFLVPLPLAQKSYYSLLAVPVLEKEKSNLTDALAKQQSAADSFKAALDSEQKAHTSDQVACTADKNTLNAEIKDVKAQAVKDKTKWGAFGVVIGFIIKAVIH